jgi:hypothetical protein
MSIVKGGGFAGARFPLLCGLRSGSLDNEFDVELTRHHVANSPCQKLSTIIAILRNGFSHFMNENRHLYGIMNKK